MSTLCCFNLTCRWGGVVLINPSSEACAAGAPNKPVVIIPNEITVVGTFLAQLKLLLGIPEPVIEQFTYILSTPITRCQNNDYWFRFINSFSIFILEILTRRYYCLFGRIEIARLGGRRFATRSHDRAIDFG